MDFVVVHIPHASLSLPPEFRRSILLDDKALHREICRMTDSFCDELYDAPEFPVRLCAKVSRLVCDMERFRDDKAERNARRGQGLMYTRTSLGRKLRENDPALRERLLKDFYDPHHEALQSLTAIALAKHGKCLIIDGHSFHPRTIRHLDNILGLPDFDIGTDPFHTPPDLRDALVERIKAAGFTVKVNNPFSGALTPQKYYEKDKRVMSVMIEVNRRLYEKDLVKTKDFGKIRAFCRELMLTARDVS
ncbi:hypothetical protein FACS1894147_07380 [Spirochaetia bacterium]|nr:hypothetical protein FACS1894147_07380 [Spirochaetia bacterium]